MFDLTTQKVSEAESATPDIRSQPPATRLVTIYINNREVSISFGTHKVPELKNLGHVPECDELAEVVSGKPIALPDDGTTHIEGQERFLSSPRSCGSS